MAAAVETTTPHVITAPDHDISTLPRYTCEGATGARIGAVCDTPGATMTCRLICWDALGLFQSATATTTFTADTIARDGPLYLGTPEPDAWFPLCGPSVFSIHVDSISGGAWTLTPIAS